MTDFNPFGCFDHIYCFNLPNETKRREQMDEQFEKYRVTDKVQYLYADRPPKGFTMSNMRRGALGEFGVNLTQMKGIVHAINDGAKFPLFLEDDVVFADDTYERLAAAIIELPNDWEMFYLGGHPRGPLPQYRAKKYSKNLVKIGRMSFADAYVVRGNTLLRFADEWFNRISQSKAMYDIILGDFAAKCNTYCVYPLICKQRAGVSSISGKYDDKTNLLNKAWKNHLG